MLPRFLRLLLVCSLAAASVRGVTLDVQWLIGSGSWNSAANWAGNVLPGTSDRALIDPFESGSITVTVDASAAVNDLTIGTGDVVRVVNAVSFTFDSDGDDSVLDLGTGAALQLRSTGSMTNLIINGGTLQVTGSGEIDMGSAANNRIFGVGSGATLDNQATVRGSGQLGVDSLAFLNSGTIQANQINSLVIDPDDAAGLTNTGLLEAISNATLTLQDGQFTNTGGQIHAATGSTVLLNGGVTISDGTLQSTGTGGFTATGTNTLTGGVTLTAGATINLTNAGNLYLKDTLNGDGSITVSSTGSFTNIVVHADGASLDAGSITMGSGTNNRIIAASSGAHFTNRGTVSGAGQVSVDDLQVTNDGTISATHSNALTIDPDDTNGFTNNGSLTAASGATLRLIDGVFTNTTTISTDGGTVELDGGATITGGSLTSSNGGQFIIDGSNTLADLSLTSGTEVAVSNADHLTLSGNIANDGTITVTSTGSFTNIIVPTGSTHTWSGTGVVQLSGSNARIIGSGTPTLTNSSNTIRGTGQVGADSLTLNNQATIEANVNDERLTVDPDDTGGLTNTGTIEAVNGGILRINDATVANLGGLIRAQSGSDLELVGSTINDGSVDVGPNATLDFNGSTLSNTSLTTATNSSLTVSGALSEVSGSLNLSDSAELTVQNGSSLRFVSTGTYVNAGTIKLDSAGSHTNLIIDGGDVTLSGGGTLLLDNASNNRVYGSNGGRLINTDLTISGGGQLGLNLLGITNHGAIVANTATPLTVDPDATGLTNSGTLRADAGSTLLLTGATVDNSGGTLAANGTGATFTLASSSVSNGSFDNASGGTIATSGIVTLSNIALTAGSTLSIPNSSSAIFVGTLQNPGTVELNSIGAFSNFIVDDAGLNLSGGGSVVLGTGNNTRLYGENTGTTLHNSDNTISGSGQLGVNLLQIVNQGIIEANSPTTSLTVDTSGTGLQNTGTIRATNGATLTLSSSTVDNSGGVIQALGTANVTVSNSAVSNGNLHSAVGAGFTVTGSSNSFTNITLSADSSLDLVNSASATFDQSLSNAGTIELQSTGSFTNFLIGSSGLNLSGGGTIELKSGNNNRILATDASYTLTVQDQTISGYGQLGANSLTVNNLDTIVASVSGQTLTLDTSNTFTNSGTLRAENGGILNLSSTTFDNLGGTISADGSSSVTLTNAAISNGSLSGDFNAAGVSSSLTNISIAAGSDISVGNATAVSVAGSISHQGTLSVTSTGSTTSLLIDPGGAQFSGSGGMIELSGANARVVSTDSNAVLTLNSGQTLRGTGQLGQNSLHLQNYGTIEANGTAALTVDLSNPLNNDGTLKATGTGGLVFNDGLNNNQDVRVLSGSSLSLGANQYVQNTGVTELSDGSLTAAFIQIDGGEFSGHGDINGPATFSGGILQPTDGALDFNSTFTLDSATTVRIELAGTGGTDFGQVLGDTIVLSGDLRVRFADDFHLSILNSDTFTLFSATSSLTGEFNGLPVGTRLTTFDGRGTFALDYNSLTVTLSDFQPIPEPSTWALLILGTATLLVGRQRCRQRKP